MSSIKSASIISKGLSNNIIWDISGNGNLTINKFLPGNHNLFQDDPKLVVSNLNVSNGSDNFTDYDVSQNFIYKYQLDLNNNVKTVYCTTFSGLIDSGSVDYDYTNNKFDLSWDDAAITGDNKDENSEYIYDIFVKAEPTPSTWSNNILQFSKEGINQQLPTPTFTITNGMQAENGTIDIVINTKYTFYVSPFYSSQGDSSPTVFERRYSLTRLPNILGIFSLFPPVPSNFSIKNPYNNNKISFSWNNITIPIPSSYKITLNIDGAVVSEFPITINNNSYTLDNSNFTYIPGLYTIQVSANYYGLETEKTSINFTIPVTPISLTIKPLNNLGQVTNDYKNISSIQLNWSAFNYNNIYYKIKVKIVDKDGVSQNDLCFYTTNTNYTFPINSNTKIELKFSVSYEIGNVNTYPNDNWIYGTPAPY